MAETNGGTSLQQLDLSGGITPQIRPGGAPARVYLNEKIVPHLLEGMKAITRDQPPNPLQVLGEFLIQKSKELEEAEAKNESE
ncbi:Uncharacterized protein PECH_000301 [Penicillium ucsense]|uniref:COMPASS complex subunit Sdc1 n=1 Tax=Penicillium ucsense TaxID=2839758 RepID=A0A8J8WFK3_9EURO|nr:Uncharacterized protein PECM_008702 [Penicillium ucsense]KAF7733707.1 Uncharacterized protein PECH_000301 [Penicillium ucsense]